MDNSQDMRDVPETPAGARTVMRILFNPRRGTFVAEITGLNVSREESRAIAAEVLQAFQVTLEAIYSTRARGMADRLVGIVGKRSR